MPFINTTVTIDAAGRVVRGRISPHEALLFLDDVRQRLDMIALDETESPAVLEGAAAANVAGGSIHDSLIAHCAPKAKAQTLYTWNVRHFKRFGEQVSARVRERSRGHAVHES